MFKRIIEGKQNPEITNSEFSAASQSEGNFGGMGQFEESYLEYNEMEKLKA
jgi:hypothetical protein